MTKPGNGSASPSQVNMIGKGTVLEGTLRSDGDVSISGRVIGKLHVDGRAVVTQEGAVEGEVTATHADISGTLKGELHVQERLVLRSTARVEGAIQAGRLIVEEGAAFNGECEMGQTGQLRTRAEGPREATLPTRSERPEAAEARSNAKPDVRQREGGEKAAAS